MKFNQYIIEKYFRVLAIFNCLSFIFKFILKDCVFIYKLYFLTITSLFNQMRADHPQQPQPIR